MQIIIVVTIIIVNDVNHYLCRCLFIAMQLNFIIIKLFLLLNVFITNSKK